MLLLDTIPPAQLAALASAVGIIIASDLDVNEQNAIGNFILAIGQTILTISAQSENIKEHKGKKDICEEIDTINQQLDAIKKKIKR